MKLSFPIAVVHQPGSDRLLVITRSAVLWADQIQRIKDDPKPTTWKRCSTLSDVAYDIVFHPRLRGERLRLCRQQRLPRRQTASKTRVTRYTMDRKPPYRLDPKSAKIIIEWDSDGHNGGAMAFGYDGMLYVTSGDGTSDSDTNIVGQDMTKLLAKVLRIDVDHPDTGQDLLGADRTIRSSA